MKILSNQQINYCNLTRQTEQGLEYLPGVSYESKLHLKNAFFGLEQKQEALEYCRQKFLNSRGETSYLLVEDPTGFTIWQEDKQVNISDSNQDRDIVSQIDLKDLVSKMRNIGGVQIKDRRYNLKFYSKCFVGNEAVAWMKSELNLSTGQAIRLGQRLIDEKIIHHVVDRQKFADKFLFYRFYWDEI
ncbi:Domain found in Dishevelled, Egl-10, and Pleckstrin (DEP) [Hyella patelloides LEGE 07179]|uniref:Domain found in Dishevelled, Egl-10, and Pleckstrin (DEP) n=1 Tax=Hyella patelloides LEGE 07179 TaxID=945734 RepID=A0A563W2F0_9CYAN|nr:DEP domain-containing protein [Hyella patelloides]VEP17861.1 Domain found in Dishevelled, Egl-10, and Pleckstrin (DEP) [Hyella patelloides LEGE 07179]